MQSWLSSVNGFQNTWVDKQKYSLGCQVLMVTRRELIVKFVKLRYMFIIS